MMRQRKKELFVDKFGGKCELCGYSKCIAALDFHHVSGKKDFSPSFLIGTHSTELAEKELEKCILVCANCHRELHFAKLDTTKIIRPWLTLICPACQQEFETKDNKQVCCSRGCMHALQRVVVRPTKEELAELIAKLPWTTIGKKYGVSDNAVRRWARAYKLLERRTNG